MQWGSSIYFLIKAAGCIKQLSEYVRLIAADAFKISYFKN